MNGVEGSRIVNHSWWPGMESPIGVLLCAENATGTPFTSFVKGDWLRLLVSGHEALGKTEIDPLDIPDVVFLPLRVIGWPETWPQPDAAGYFTLLGEAALLLERDTPWEQVCEMVRTVVTRRRG